MARDLFQEAGISYGNDGEGRDLFAEAGIALERKKKRDSSATALDYLNAVDSGFAQGIANIGAGSGTVLQDPSGAIVSGLTGARAAADRGVTWLINQAGGEAQNNADIQRAAQIASEVAADRRAENVAEPWNLPAKLGRFMEQDSRAVIDDIQAKDRARNPELIRQQQAMGEAEGFVDNVKAAWDNPLALTHTLTRSLPDMAMGVGVGSALHRAGAGLGAVSTAGIASEAGSSAMQAREGTYQQVAGMPLEALAKSPRFNEILAQVKDPVKAREVLANELADQTPVLSGLGTAAGSVLVNRLFGGDATAKTIVGAEKMTARELGERIAQDTLEEGFQGVPEDTVQHGAVVQADPSKKWDPAGSLAQNMIAGLAMGSGGHGFSYARENLASLNSPSTGAPPAITPGNGNAPAGQAAPAAPITPQSGEAVATGNTDAAEKALRTPVKLTALDRVNEIDTERARIQARREELSETNGYGPAFDGERAELFADLAKLEQERADIAKSWPKALGGAPTSFSTEAGVKLDGQYALMDAADLVTSHDEGLRANPLYPTELQPRDRGRQASELQVSSIVQKLDPARLGLSADAATGAPIVGADGLVESGNARTIALKRVYQANGQKAEDYKNFLRDNAAQFGIAPEQVDGMAKPVLVRVRATPVNRAEFARQANQSTIARMSPSEQAMADAKRLTTLEGLQPDEEGNFQGSRDFIRQFMATLPITEQSDLIEADGKLSTTGYRRIQNAVLARAYGDSPSLRRMTESMDNNLVNISKALVRVAPTIAAARERMEAGTLHKADIAPDLLQAVEGLSALKDKGWTVDQELAQVDLTGPKYSTEAQELLKFLDANTRSPRRIAEFFQRYYEALEQAGDPSQPSMFGDDAPAPARGQLLNQAKEGAQNGDTAENPQRGVDREAARPAAQDGRKPEDAPGRGRSDQGNGATGTDADTRLSRTEKGKSEWVRFGADSGTLGIPRAEMPQIKAEYRGALVNFLAARGITHESAEADPATLKPTQAEFSSVKVESFMKTGPVGERSVLVSSDGHVLDGHHQWMAHRALGTPVPVIRLDAPIKPLLAAVREFPSVKQSEGATSADDVRAMAVRDFKDALADLAQIATKHTRVMMVPENTPNLMPTLVKLYDAGIKIVGTDLKRAKKWVVEQLRKDQRFKAFWNKVGDNLHQKAALQALESMDKAQKELYSAASALAALKNDASLDKVPDRGPAASMPGRGIKSPLSDNLNQAPSGRPTKSSPEKSDTNREPSGNLSGTLIDLPLDNNVPQITANGYTRGNANGENDANAQPGQGRAEGKGPRTAQKPVGQRETEPVRGGSGAADAVGNQLTDGPGQPAQRVEQAGPNGEGRQAEPGKGTQPRKGARGNAGVPAGRDIAPKSGLNYAFGEGDLTYEGSWLKKAEQNVAAVELLQTLKKEGRQATQAEQAVLAKFIGWGSSEMANNLFGPKLDKVASALSDYESVIAEMDKLKKDSLSKGGRWRGDYAEPGYYQATNLLREAKALGVHEYPQQVTRDQVKAVKPDASAVRWLALRDRLKAAMSKDELAEASRSTQYAHYTSKSVVTSMWKAMERMGFNGGAILEPGAGIGVFPGLMPQGMAANSVYTGIEFDTITGGVLKQLFPDERILVESFVDSKLPKDFYDVAIGNPPFSATPILADPEYAKKALSLHDYFFAKSIDRVKPGGLVVYVTSRYTMDKVGDKARKYLAERADLVGAIRLPQTAFQQNAGTEVVTDVIFLRKKVPGETFEGAQTWQGVAQAVDADGKPLMVSAGKDKGDKPGLINEYFVAHPEMVLGQHGNTGSMYSDKEYTVTPLAGDIEAHFAAAVEKLPANIYKAGRGSSAEAAKVREIDFNPKAKKEGNYYLTDAGQLMIREGGVGVRVELRSAKDAEVIKSFVPLRDALKQAHYDQLNDGDWETSLKALQKAYADFTEKHGQINQFTTKTVTVKVEELDEEGTPTGNKVADEQVRRTFPLLDILGDDPDATLVQALEDINDDTGVIKPGKFLTDRVLAKPVTAEVSTPMDALLTTLNDLGHVDIATVADRVGLTEAETIEALGTAVYEDPSAGWVMADEYITGNVKRKLELAREAAETDRRFERNVAVLEANQPEPLAPSQIDPRLGMNWIPSDVYEQFMREVVGLRMGIEWHPRTKSWVMDWESMSTHHLVNQWGKVEGTYKSQEAAQKAADKKNERYQSPRFFVKAIETPDVAASTEEWGTIDVPAQQIMEHALTGRPLRVESKDKDNKSVFNPAATEAAKEKLDQMHEKFVSWLFAEPKRTDRLVSLYNDKFNTTVARKFDGRHLTLPGTSKQFDVFDHVKRGAWRIIQKGNTYLAHAVGSGKTFMMVISAMEQKRLGLVKKPMVVVPNHMLKQFAHEWQQLYPAARLMVADERNFHTDNRRRFVSRVALSDLDGVIITHSAFKLLDLDPEFKAKMIEEQLQFFRAALEEAGGDPDEKGKSRDPKIKRIEKQIENMEQKLQAAMSSEGKDKNVRFDELGVDFLYVDEAHAYRKLDFTTNRQVKGLSPMGSGQAFDLFMKTRYLEEKTPGRSLVLASGTPVTNTIAELYTVQKMLGYQDLVDKGIEDFDSWASMFGREKTTLEPNAAGKYEMVTRFQDFANVADLTQMFREFADVLTSDQLAEMLGDKRPKVEGGARKIVATPETAEYSDFREQLEQRMERSKAWKPSKDEPYNPDPVIKIIGDGRLAAIDMRFMDPSLPSNPDSKLNRMIDDVIAALKETANYEYRTKNKKDADGNEIENSGDLEPTKGAAAMVFSDLGFGAGAAQTRGFNARAWFEKRLRDAGIPESQVAFIGDYKKSADKLKLFKDVNAGRVRLLVGSSKNMGTGVNAQQRLKDLFHLDSPWFPADLEQREGRIIRQGNKNPVVRIKAYAGIGTYDQQMWGQLANKQMFIDKALSGDPSVRKIEDAGAADLMAMAAGMVAKDPRVLELAGLNAEIAKLQRLYQAHEDAKSTYRQRFGQAEVTYEWNQKRLPAAQEAAKQVQELSGDKFTAKVLGKVYTDRSKWGEALIQQYKDLTARAEQNPLTVGEISGFPIMFGVDKGMKVDGQYVTKMMLGTPEPTMLVNDPGTSAVGVAMRAQNGVVEVARLPGKMRERIAEAAAQMDALRGKMSADFPMAPLLSEKQRARDALIVAMATTNTAPAPEPEMDPEEAMMGAAMGMIPPQIYLSRGSVPNTGGMGVKALGSLVDGLKAKNPNLPKVNVLADPSTAPKALREYINRQDAWYDVEGAMHDGQLYLFASGLADPLRAEHVLIEHEGGHYGLRAVLGDKLRVAMNLIYANNGQVRKAATDLQKRGKLTNAEATEEVIVDIPTAKLAKLTGWRKVTAMARDWLAAHGYDRMAQKLTDWLDGSLSDQQRADLFVAELVRAARDYVAGKRPGRRPLAGTRLSATLAEDIDRQEKWLQAEAKQRGYKDIEDLLEKNYPLFEKLATLWREKNPADTLLSRDPDGYAKAVRLWQAAMDRATAGKGMAEAGESIDMPMPTVYQAMGLKPAKLSLPVRYMQGIRSDHRDLPAHVLRDLPQLLSDPLVVIPHLEGGYRVMIEAQTAKGEPIVVGLSMDGRVQTVTPMHNTGAETGAAKFAFMLEKELAKDGVKVYARNKEALVKTRASRGVAMGTLNPNHSSSTAAVPAISALHRSPRDRAILVTRDKVVKTKGEFGPGIRLSRATPAAPLADRVNNILATKVGKLRPLDAAARMLTRATGIERLTGAIYNLAAYLLDRYTPEQVKAGVVSDYGVPQAVIDQRTLLQGRQRVQLRKAGELIEKLSTLTRAESRVAYEWMNMDGQDPRAYMSMMQGLPEESVKVLTDVQKLIDQLSKEAVRMGQLSQDAYERNKFAYLRRSYAKHILEQTNGEKAKRARAISILGDQYKGRGLTESAAMDKIKSAAPEWWGRKLAGGKADTALKGEKFVRLEYRTHKQSGVAVRLLKNGVKPYYVTRNAMVDNKTGLLPGMEVAAHNTKLAEVVYWPAGVPMPAKYKEWDQAGTWEVRDVKGPNAIFWRDFTKEERETMGEVDEARFAIAKTLHGMIHDVEVGRYLEWMAVNQAKKEGEAIPGTVVEASERMRDTFAPGEWVRVPDSKIAGTDVLKYGKLAGRYLPGPVWNDLRQVVGGQFKPFGDVYAQVLSAWKTAKTALSPAVHMNNVMSNFVMADWHDVGAAHVAKSLRILLAASSKDTLAKGGIADREAAREILARYSESGADIGSWVTNEIATDQLEPLMAALEKELAATAGDSTAAQTGAFAALQHALRLRFPSAWEAFKPTKAGKAVAGGAQGLIDLYQAEDDVFRLAAWLKAKEDGATDIDAGKRARTSFLDYSINAPWIQAMRQSAWPFISFTYRAVPMLAEIAAKKPHKLMKLMMIAGGLNALGVMLAGGGDDDEERKLLPEEKAGSIWGMVPKLIRMPWNDDHGSAVYLDIRRFVPVGDVFDVDQGNAAVPILPGLMPGGPLVLMGEVVLNKSAFTGKAITLETDTKMQQAQKVADYLYKAFAPNILGLPGTYATEGLVGSMTGRTDAFGREMSTAQAVASSFGVKLGSYPADVLRRNLNAKAQAEMMEIQKNISQFKRQRQTGRLDQDEYEDKVRVELEKKQKIMRELGEKMN